MIKLEHIANKNILLSPLDWGFGHTTRCVPIIQELLKHNNSIVFAGNKPQIEFIGKEFPTIKTIFIEGYNVQLTSEKSTYLQIGKQITKINTAIKNENEWVKSYISQYQVDLIISDNRYGFRHPDIESIFIGHQLNLELPQFKKFVNGKLTKYINRFNSCWIPDNERFNLSGTLADTTLLNIPFKLIGLLSRFSKIESTIKYDYLFIITGPTPENSLFLKACEDKIAKTELRIVIVSTIESAKPISSVDYFYNPTTKELNQLLNESDCIISKAGYTTIMELVSLNKKAILIPTKGQFEQTYLAKHIKHDKLKFVNSINEIKI